MRMPDNPKLVSLDFLRKLDTDPPGTWLAQPKYDGWRRVIWRTAGGPWQFQAKHAGPAAAPLPAGLQSAFETLAWPETIVLDCEWTGKRAQAGNHKLFVFDIPIYNYSGAICDSDTNLPLKPTFVHRSGLLWYMWEKMQVPLDYPVQVLPTWPNPGLPDLFMQQTQDPLSEGLVIRKADSTLIGAGKCADNPYWFKVKFEPVLGGADQKIIREKWPHLGGGGGSGLVCRSCGATGPHNWYEGEGEWCGERQGEGGIIHYTGYAECLTCGNRQRVFPERDSTGN